MKTKTILFASLTSLILSCNTSHNSTFEVFEMPSISQNSSTDVFCAIKNNKAGWMNVYGDWVIQPELDTNFVREWSEGTLVCKKGEKYGVINYKNEIIIPFEYDEPPNNCDQGLIAIYINDGNYGKSAYFNKKGKQVCEFMNPLPEFRNGYSVLTSNRKLLGSYPRLDLQDSDNNQTEIYTSDFAIVDINFDTLLTIKDSPFLIELGSLHNGLRSFVLYPNMSLHADGGISYGMYGYLNQYGEIEIKPKFSSIYALTENEQGFTREPNFPFSSNHSLVFGDNGQFYFINTEGKKKVDINFPKRKIISVSSYNDYGLACIRTGEGTPKSTMAHVIDTTGKIVFESNETEAYFGMSGTIISGFNNTFIPVTDLKNQELKLYSPSFNLLGTFLLKDLDFRYRYYYNEVQFDEKENRYYLIQERIIDDRYSPLNQKRVLSESGKPLTDWISRNSALSYKFSVFSISDTISKTITFNSFSKKYLFSCSFCTLDSDERLEYYGVFKLYLSDKSTKIINHQGKVLSDSFTSMTSKIISLKEQIENYEKNEKLKIKLDETTLFEIFNNSEMHTRIVK